VYRPRRPRVAQGNLGLVPELHPFVLDRVIELELGRDRGAKLELLHELDDNFDLKGFLQHGQHLQLVLRTDTLDVLEDCRGARSSTAPAPCGTSDWKCRMLGFSSTT